MNKHIKRKVFYNNHGNNNGNEKRGKDKPSSINYSHGFPKGCTVTKQEDAFLLRINGKKRARFFFPANIETVKKYASAYVRYIKEFKLKV